jgi:hypothetical protein
VPIGIPTERYAQILSGQTGTTILSPATTIAAGTCAFVLATIGANKTISSVVDSVGNTWTVDKTISDGTRAVGSASAEIVTQITSSDTITITWSNATSSQAHIWVQEVTGLVTSSPFDTFKTGTGTTTDLTTGPTATLAQANEIAFACFRCNTANTTWTKDASWSNPTTPTLDAFSGLEYIIVASTAALTAAPTGPAATANWSGLVVTYKGGAAGPQMIPGPPPVLGLQA